MKRRAFVAAGATMAAAGLGGCVSRDAELSEPHLDHPGIDTDWEELEASRNVVFEDEVGPVTVTATENRVMYENLSLREEIREKTLDGLDAQLSLVFATRIDLSPAVDQLPLGVGRRELMNELRATGRRQFEQQLRASDLDDIEHVETDDWTAAGGHDGTLDRYEATFAVDDMRFDLVGDTTLTIEGSDMEVTGWLAAWHDGEFPMLAGGVHPGENFSRTIDEALTDAIHLTLSIDLGLDPDAYSEEVRDVISSVS